ncbi:MAG: LPS export ABC transporter periplasmic protein LptC [Candidatus Omnitrophota bacterium]
MKGQTADIFDTVIKLKEVVGNMYGDTEKIKLTAQKGDFDKTEGKVHLEKDVVITTSSGARMTTDSLDWDRKNQLVTTKDKVDIQKESMTTTATGLKGNPSLNKLNFEKDVQVEIDPSKAVNAKAGTSPDKIIITCDGPLEVDYEKNVAIFKNNVAVNNKDMQLYSDTMDIYFAKPEKSAVKSADPSASLMNSSIDKMIAKGNVKIVKGDNTSYSDEATYNSADKRIVLTGRPKLVLSSTADLSGMFGAVK